MKKAAGLDFSTCRVIILRKRFKTKYKLDSKKDCNNIFFNNDERDFGTKDNWCF